MIVYNGLEDGKKTMKNLHNINGNLRNPLTREETLLEVAEWVKDTCLIFGTSISMAYKVASMFVRGLASEVSVDTQEKE